MGLLWHNRLRRTSSVGLLHLISTGSKQFAAAGAERIDRLIQDARVRKRRGPGRAVGACWDERNGLATQTKCDLWCACS